jgi:hypothetical protein
MRKRPLQALPTRMLVDVVFHPYAIRHRFRAALHYAFRQRGVLVLRALVPPSRRVQPIHRNRIGRKASDYGRTIALEGRTPRCLTTHRCDGGRQGPGQQTHALPSVRVVVMLMLS